MCIGGGDPHTCTHRDTYMYVAPGHRRVDSLNSKYKYRKEKKKQMQKKKTQTPHRAHRDTNLREDVEVRNRLRLS